MNSKYYNYEGIALPQRLFADDNKLSVVLLDDDEASLLYLTQLIESNELASITGVFNDPVKFLNTLPHLRFDALILDFDMPGINGKEIIKKVGGEKCILHTASIDKLKEPLKRHPVDNLVKPTTLKALRGALNRITRLIMTEEKEFWNKSREHTVVNTIDDSGKLVRRYIRWRNIVYATLKQKKHPGNKDVYFADGTILVFKDYSLIEIKEIGRHLHQPSQSHLVSEESITIIEATYFYIKLPNSDEQIMIPIGDTYSADFKKELDKS